MGISIHTASRGILSHSIAMMLLPVNPPLFFPLPVMSGSHSIPSVSPLSGDCPVLFLCFIWSSLPLFMLAAFQGKEGEWRKESRQKWIWVWQVGLIKANIDRNMESYLEKIMFNTHRWACAHTHAHTCICTYRHTCMCTHTHVHTYVHTHILSSSCLQVWN